MRCLCLVCGKEWIKAGEVGLVSHGVCDEGVCKRVLEAWTFDSQGLALKEYYAAVLDKQIIL